MAGIESAASVGVPFFSDLHRLLPALWKPCRQHHRSSFPTRSPAFPTPGSMLAVDG